jgi:hypothetical protein
MLEEREQLREPELAPSLEHFLETLKVEVPIQVCSPFLEQISVSPTSSEHWNQMTHYWQLRFAHLSSPQERQLVPHEPRQQRERK